MRATYGVPHDFEYSATEISVNIQSNAIKVIFLLEQRTIMLGWLSDFQLFIYK